MMNAGLTFIPFQNRPTSVKHATTLKRIGNRRGWPDFFVFDHPNIQMCYPVLFGRKTFTVAAYPAGVALELKKDEKEEPRPDQLERMEELRKLGWLVYWGTSNELITHLKKAYGI